MDEEKVEVRKRKDKEFGCMTANDVLICYCGECKQEDYALPEDYFPLKVEVDVGDWTGVVGTKSEKS